MNVDIYGQMCYNIHIMPESFPQEGQCPVDHKAMLRELWDQHRDSYDIGREIFDPLGKEIANRLEEDIAAEPETFRKQSENYALSLEIPLDLPKWLPPTLFMGSETNELPANAEEAERLADEYFEYSESLLKDVHGIHPTGPYSREKVRETLAEAALGRITLNQSTWQAYEAAYELEAARGTYLLGFQSDNRHGNIDSFNRRFDPNLLPEMKQAETYVYGSAAVTYWNKQTGNSIGTVMMPVGEYGSEFAGKLVRLTTLTMDYSANNFLEEARAAVDNEDREDYILNHSARGPYIGSTHGAAESALATVAEGTLSIGQTLGLLTAEKVPGYETGEELIAAIFDQGIVRDVTRLLSLGLIGPLNLSGNHFPGFLQSDASGKLSLDPGIKQTLETLQAEWIRLVYTNWQQTPENGRNANGGYGLVCPANTPRGAIASMSHAMAKLMPLVSSREGAKAYAPWRMPGHRFSF